MWTPIPGYEGIYEASRDGAVRRVSSRRWLQSRAGANGYVYVNLSRDNDRGRTVTLHSVIASAFLGPRPLGADVCHADGDKANNRADNLRYDTRTGNMADTIRAGRIARGERAGASKYSEDQIRAVRAALTAGRSYSQIASEFGMPISTIQSIKQRKTWRWLA